MDHSVFFLLHNVHPMQWDNCQICWFARNCSIQLWKKVTESSTAKKCVVAWQRPLVPHKVSVCSRPPTGKKNMWPHAHTHTHTQSPAGSPRVDGALQLLTQCGISICATSYVPLTLSKVRLHHINDASFESSIASRNHAGRSGGTPYFQGSSSLSKAAICVGEDLWAAAGTLDQLGQQRFDVMSLTPTLPVRALRSEVTVWGLAQKWPEKLKGGTFGSPVTSCGATERQKCSICFLSAKYCTFGLCCAARPGRRSG